MTKSYNGHSKSCIYILHIFSEICLRRGKNMILRNIKVFYVLKLCFKNYVTLQNALFICIKPDSLTFIKGY